MGELLSITALQYAEADSEFTLVNLASLREVQSTGSPLRIKGYPFIDSKYVSSEFGPWFINNDVLAQYDVFISHRWHECDDEVVQQLYEGFHGNFVGSEMRAVKVFYDKIRLKDGQQFQNAFGKALINSTVLVPILCTTALQKMLKHDPLSEDNVLIEWILALECMQDQNHSKMRGIYPLMFGERKGSTMGNLFDEGIINQLPKIIPKASIKVVRKLLKENGVTVSSSLSKCTVRGVVTEISKFMGLRGWEHKDNLIFTALSAILKQV